MRTPYSFTGNGAVTLKIVLKKDYGCRTTQLAEHRTAKIPIFYQNTLNGNEISTFGNFMTKPGGVVLLLENVAKNTFADDLTISKKPS